MNNLKGCKVSYEEWKSRVGINNEFELVEIYYKKREDNNRNTTWLKIKHLNCGTIFDRSSSTLSNKRSCGSINCPKCGNRLSVSYLHSTITTIAFEIYDNCKIEYDIGFKGEKGRPSKYDLYIPKLNLLIEFQSRYHDNRKDFDNKKKDYALSQGYNYKTYDHRHDNINEVAYELFGIEDISTYRNSDKFKKYNSFDLELAQKLINDYTPIKKVGELVGVSEFCISSYIDRGLLTTPNKYVETIRNEQEIVQLTMDGEFVNVFKNTNHATKSFGKRVTFNRSKQVNYLHGYVWVTYEDYKANNYTIDDIRQRHCKTFYMIDDNYNILKTYTSLEEARKDINVSHTSFIAQVLRHELDHVRNKKFIFKYEYDNLQQIS